MLRALYEGVMFEHRRHIEVLISAGVQFGDVILSGGGARSPVWLQIFADGLGKPVTIAASQETGHRAPRSRPDSAPALSLPMRQGLQE